MDRNTLGANKYRIYISHDGGETWIPYDGGSGGGGTSAPFGSPFPASGTAAGFLGSTGDMEGATLAADGSLEVTVVGGSTGNGAASNTGAAVPTQADYLGVSIGGTLRGVTGANPSGVLYAVQMDLASIAGKTVETLDYDTGGGTDAMPIFGIALPGAGGAVAGGTATNPLRVDPTGTTTQPVSASALPLPSGAATEATLATRLSESDFDTKTGSLTETAPTTDTASSGLNGRLQRIAQRITSLIALLPTALSGGGNLKVAPQAETSGGLLTAMMTSADGSTALTATAQAIKASAGQLYGWYIYNPNATAIYVSIYNVAAASVTVGTTNPQNSFCIPALSAANVLGTLGIEFTNAGWSAAATTTGGGNTAPGTALEANFFYK